MQVHQIRDENKIETERAKMVSELQDDLKHIENWNIKEEER